MTNLLILFLLVKIYQYKIFKTITDADKKNYIHYYNTILSKNLLKEDGLMVIDNVLFKGLVTQFNENKKENSKEEQSSHLISIAKLIHEFNQYIAQDQRTEKVTYL